MTVHILWVGHLLTGERAESVTFELKGPGQELRDAANVLVGVSGSNYDFYVRDDDQWVPFSLWEESDEDEEEEREVSITSVFEFDDSLREFCDKVREAEDFDTKRRLAANIRSEVKRRVREELSEVGVVHDNLEIEFLTVQVRR